MALRKPRPPPETPPDPTTLGLSNARSHALQTILLDDDIPAFLNLFKLPIPHHPLPQRIDVPRGITFDSWLLHTLYIQHEEVPPGTRPWDVNMNLSWTYNGMKIDHSFSGPIWTTRLRPHGTYPGTVERIERFLERVKVTGEFLYRGTSRCDARSALQEFKPASVECTDLGTGLYTSRDPELALGYAGYNGVVWVFRCPDFKDIQKVKLTGGDWELVAGGVKRVACEGDVLFGAVSDDRAVAGMQGCVEGKVKVQKMENGEKWMCWRTDKGRRLLAAGLVAMVFLDNECAEIVDNRLL